jgi:hypothetical protein
MYLKFVSNGWAGLTLGWGVNISLYQALVGEMPAMCAHQLMRFNTKSLGFVHSMDKRSAFDVGRVLWIKDFQCKFPVHASQLWPTTCGWRRQFHLRLNCSGGNGDMNKTTYKQHIGQHQLEPG